MATHGIAGNLHYAKWFREHHFDAIGGFYQVLDGDLNVNAEGGGDTNAPQVKVNPIERDWYHTDWVADRTIEWLRSLDSDDDFFCWTSFPDPHHPWDPPQSEIHRVPWRDVDLPENYPTLASERGGDTRRQGSSLATLVRRRSRVELRSPGQVGAGVVNGRPSSRSQRPQRR
jgi:hypothetical protein